MVILRARRWLDNEEFKELLKIADYMGKVDGKATFTFNLDKALRNGYSYEDVILLIQDYGLEIDSSDLEELKELFNRVNVVVEWERSRGLVRVRIPWGIYYRVREVVKKHGGKYVNKDESGITYTVLPSELLNLADELTSLGVNVSDPERLLKEKLLPVKPVLKNIELREYQKEALDKWAENKYRGVIALPTGSGKTIIGIAAFTLKPVRTLIIAYTREQVFQWREAIIKYTNIDPAYIGLIHSGEKKIGYITITTYQSGYRIINEISPYFDLLIVDEVHHLPAEKFRHIAVHSIARYRMGLSATPVREDGKHVELFPLLGGIIYYRSPEELAEKGYLARYVIETVKVKLAREEMEEFEKLRREYRKLVGSAKFSEVLEAARKGDPKAREALKIHSQMRMILARSKSKIEKAVEIARREASRGNKVIVFTQYVDQAKKISELLNAYLLTGETPVEERKRILAEFREKPGGILVVTTVGDEGLDIPDANIGIIVSGTGSRRQFVQRLGRLLRPKKNGGEAKLYEIVLVKTPEEYQALKRKSIDLDEFLTEE